MQYIHWITCKLQQGKYEVQLRNAWGKNPSPQLESKPNATTFQILVPSCLVPILGDPGAVSRVDKMFVVKVYCRDRDEPLDTYSYRTSSRSVWIACFWLARKNFFWPISEEKLPGDSCVFLHDVVFLIDRHSCVARSTGKVSRRKFQNKMLTTRKIATFSTTTRNKHSPMNF